MSEREREREYQNEFAPCPKNMRPRENRLVVVEAFMRVSLSEPVSPLCAGYLYEWPPLPVIAIASLAYPRAELESA